MRAARLGLAAILAAVPLAGAPEASARVSADVAALQVALRALDHYHGTVDGVAGPGTTRAVRAFQRRAGIAVDGVAGPRTRRALGRRGRPRLGSRTLRAGHSGWDVAALQFLLARHGFPSGRVDGGLGRRTSAALRRFQRWSRLAADGIVGPATLARLRRAPPATSRALSRPSSARIGDRFGPRGDRFHAGLDFPAGHGATVRAARGGVVTSAGWRDGGFGLTVSIAHGGGLRTLYAHLSAVHVRRGTRVGTGAPVGDVGATGAASGPHLHFELRLRGAALNPLPAF